MKGIVFDIQRFSVHDGPGIRTTVFMKGCPLRCKWCHNPEGLSKEIQLQFFEEKCLGCGSCGKRDSLSDADKCPSQALIVCGREISEDQLVAEILKDSVFYDADGGVTFSGGECLLQSDFVASVLKTVKAAGFSTAVDTSGYVPWDAFDKTVEYCDIYLYDIKIASNSLHKRFTGVGNELILRNLKRLCESKKRIWIRVPVIPGVNDNEKEMTDIADIVSSVGDIEQVTLMPYHTLGADRYKTIGLEYRFDRTLRVSEESMSSFKNIFIKRKIKLV